MNRENGAKLVAGGAFLDAFVFDFGCGKNRARHIEKLFRGARDTLLEHQRAFALDHIQITFTAFGGAHFFARVRLTTLDAAGRLVFYFPALRAGVIDYCFIRHSALVAFAGSCVRAF